MAETCTQTLLLTPRRVKHARSARHERPANIPAMMLGLAIMGVLQLIHLLLSEEFESSLVLRPFFVPTGMSREGKVNHEYRSMEALITKEGWLTADAWHASHMAVSQLSTADFALTESNATLPAGCVAVCSGGGNSAGGGGGGGGGGSGGGSASAAGAPAVRPRYACPVPHCKDRSGKPMTFARCTGDVGQCTMWGGGRVLLCSILQPLSSGGETMFALGVHRLSSGGSESSEPPLASLRTADS